MDMQSRPIKTAIQTKITKTRITPRKIVSRSKSYKQRNDIQDSSLKTKVIKLLIIIVLCIFPIYTLCYVFSDCINTAIATVTVETFTIPKSALTQAEDNVFLDVKRKIQKHYLSYDKYVPIENIFFTDKNAMLYPAVKKECGTSFLHAYLSLKFSFPFIGTITKDVCVTLKTKIN